MAEPAIVNGTPEPDETRNEEAKPSSPTPSQLPPDDEPTPSTPKTRRSTTSKPRTKTPGTRPRSNPDWHWDSAAKDTLLLTALTLHPTRSWPVIASHINAALGVTNDQCYERHRVLTKRGNKTGKGPSEKWDDAKDEILLEWERTQGTGAWVECAKLLNETFGVTASQCSERERVLRRRMEAGGDEKPKRKRGGK
ncbi:hypothetical protein HK104_007534, partial [Borealophlyctis nickersoniae]